MNEVVTIIIAVVIDILVAVFTINIAISGNTDLNTVAINQDQVNAENAAIISYKYDARFDDKEVYAQSIIALMAEMHNVKPVILENVAYFDAERYKVKGVIKDGETEREISFDSCQKPGSGETKGFSIQNLNKLVDYNARYKAKLVKDTVGNTVAYYIVKESS